MTTADAAAERSGAAPEGLLARHPLLFFFLIAFAGTWLVELPYVLSEDGAGLLPFRLPLPSGIMIALSVFLGPFLAAFIMTGVTEGRAGIGRLLRRMVLWRVGIRWYLFALIGIPVIFVLSAIVLLLSDLASFQGVFSTMALGYLLTFAPMFFFGGPLGEEPGWRGFALPRLQLLHGPLLGSLILGPLWALWHLPLFFVPSGDSPLTMFNLGLFLISITFSTIIYTWVFNNTKGSVLMTMLVHTSNNAFLALLFSAFIVSVEDALIAIIGNGTLALLIVALTRGRLGYQHYHPEQIAQTTAPA
jgi:membrane protease YdiL (CAAX protease family)